jgi:hypothetical protein
MLIQHIPIRHPRAGHFAEFVFACRWFLLMNREDSLGESPLHQILSSYASRVGQREASVAASLICWLGTNIGQSVLEEGRRLEVDFEQPGDGYLAAWSVHNRRCFNKLNGWRALEHMVQSLQDQKEGLMPSCSADDLEVAEHVMFWLGSKQGQRFLAQVGAEVERCRKLEALASFHRRGVNSPVVGRLQDELAVIDESISRLA